MFVQCSYTISTLLVHCLHTVCTLFVLTSHESSIMESWRVALRGDCLPYWQRLDKVPRPKHPNLRCPPRLGIRVAPEEAKAVEEAVAAAEAVEEKATSALNAAHKATAAPEGSTRGNSSTRGQQGHRRHSPNIRVSPSGAGSIVHPYAAIILKCEAKG